MEEALKLKYLNVSKFIEKSKDKEILKEEFESTISKLQEQSSYVRQKREAKQESSSDFWIEWNRNDRV